MEQEYIEVETIKECPKCKKDRSINEFKDGNKRCNICLAKGKEYYSSNKEKHHQWYLERYERDKEHMLEVSREYKKIKIECAVCNCIIKKYKKAEHERTKKHINNLNKKEEQPATFAKLYAIMHQ